MVLAVALYANTPQYFRLTRMGATQLKRRHKTHPVKASSSPQTYCRYRGANCYDNNIAGGVSWD